VRNYLNKTDAITDLHKQGFTDDFQMIGNDLLWVQENLLVRMGEFAIAESYKAEGSIVFGIIALHHNIKGILLKRLGNPNEIAPVLVKKLNEINLLKHYVRHTEDLQQRINEHNSGIGGDFTSITGSAPQFLSS